VRGWKLWLDANILIGIAGLLLLLCVVLCGLAWGVTHAEAPSTDPQMWIGFGLFLLVLVVSPVGLLVFWILARKRSDSQNREQEH
jgi:hypothetical protein